MSPKMSRQAPEPEDAGEPALPPGHVPLRPPPAPERKPVSWWWGFGGFVVVVTAAVVAIVYASQPHQDSARGTAELAAGALTDADVDAFASYVCEDLAEPDEWTDLGETTVLAVSEERDGEALATLTPSRPRGVDLLLSLENRDDTWCVAAADLCSRANDTLPNSPVSESPRCQFRPGRD